MEYKTCPCCGANLDPGESCDCQDTEEPVATSQEEKESPATVQS